MAKVTKVNVLVLGLLVLLVQMIGCQPASDETADATADAGAHAGESPDVEAQIADALSAALPSMAATARVVDWDGNVLRDGDGPYTCMPTPPQFVDGRAPMCMDKPWSAWADAWGRRTELSISHLGISYMLAGDEGASNIDPFATEATAENEWVVEGPHLMLIVPDPALLEGISTDPDNGGPYVMWKGTPYAHVMVPVELLPRPWPFKLPRSVAPFRWRVPRKCTLRVREGSPGRPHTGSPPSRAPSNTDATAKPASRASERPRSLDFQTPAAL